MTYKDELIYGDAPRDRSIWTPVAVGCAIVLAGALSVTLLTGKSTGINLGLDRTETVTRDRGGCQAGAPTGLIFALDRGVDLLDLQLAELPKILARGFADLPPEQALEVYGLSGATSHAPERVLRRCQPDPDALQGTDVYKARQQEKAVDAVQASLNSIKAIPDQPIRTDLGLSLEAILYQSALSPGATITLVSDFAEPPSRLAADTRLDGMQVNLVHAARRREGDALEAANINGWQTALSAAGAELSPRITRLEVPHAEELDTAGCAPEPASRQLVLIDTTDPIAQLQMSAIPALARAATEDLDAGGMLEIYPMQENASATRPVPWLRICMPQNASEGERRDLAKMVSTRMAEGLQAFPEAGSSPLMREFSRIWANLGPVRGPTKVTVFSDMLFNSGAQGVAFFDNGQSNFADRQARPEVQANLVNLDGAEVQVIYLNRTAKGWDALQNQTHKTFVADWLQAQNAQLVPDGWLITLPDA